VLDPDKPDAPPRTYGFKPKDFERVNAPAGGEPPPPSAKDLAMLAGGNVQGAPTATAKPGLPAVASAKAGDPNDVFTLLQENRRVEQRHGLGEVEIRKKKSRRHRDFWLLLAGGNLTIVAATFISGLNVVTALFGFAGLIMFTLGTTWIMWFVMDDY